MPLQITKNYVGDSGIERQALFLISLWNEYNNDAAEGYNPRMGKYLQAHPNTWLFITKFKT
jgi:hypothetical protein